MADDTQRLIVSLEAQVTKFERAMNKANREAMKNLRQIEKRFDEANGNLTEGLRRVGGGLLGAFAGVEVVRAATRFADAATRVENSLKAAGLAGDELTLVYDRLFQSAQNNAAPLESLVQLYGRAAIVQKELNVTTAELLDFTDKVALALRVSGQSAEEASGALLQLSQGLGSGIIRAEEFNAILEGALPIAQAAAAGLEEAGGSVSKLRKLVTDGKVSSEAFFRAFQAGAVTLEERVASAETTVSQQFVRLQNVLIDTAGKMDDATGAGETLRDTLGGMEEVIRAVGDYFRDNTKPIQEWTGAISGAWKAVEDFKEAVRNGLGLQELDDFLEGTSLIKGTFGKLSAQRGMVPAAGQDIVRQLEEKLAERQNLSATAIQNGFAAALDRDIAELERRLVEIETGTSGGPRRGGLTGSSVRPPLADAPPSPAGAPPPLPPTRPSGSSGVQTVSINDYKVTGDDKKGKLNAYQRELAQIREATEALRDETNVRKGLNPLVDDYGYAVEKARARRELLTAAEKAGVKVGPELEAQINAAAEAYATASVEAQKLAESQAEAVANAEEMRDTLRQSVGNIVDDLIAGRNAAEAFADALADVGSRLLNVGLDTLFGMNGTRGGSGGLLGGTIIPGILQETPGAKKAAATLDRNMPSPMDRRSPPPPLFNPGETDIRKVAAQQGGAASQVHISLSPGLEAAILAEARGQAVKIVGENNRRAVPRIARDAAGRARRMSTRPGFED
ncbi:tape measure protein [Stappia sp. WLB 29]|uniref:tape measure protein n=1 Tax=Stappia sp. WLB 29 TaxID=2925220 RepID=UPI0020BE3036|nr:tape measure protein [Stappia sp. WLB 29]